MSISVLILSSKSPKKVKSCFDIELNANFVECGVGKEINMGLKAAF